jgi:ubiquitin-conjugating enzyme E2 O
MFPADSSSNGEVEDSGENNTMQKYRNFKQFDNVEDFSDHHYRGTSVSDLPVSKVNCRFNSPSIPLTQIHA